MGYDKALKDGFPSGGRARRGEKHPDGAMGRLSVDGCAFPSISTDAQAYVPRAILPRGGFLVLVRELEELGFEVSLRETPQAIRWVLGHYWAKPGGEKRPHVMFLRPLLRRAPVGFRWELWQEPPFVSRACRRFPLDRNGVVARALRRQGARLMTFHQRPLPRPGRRPPARCRRRHRGLSSRAPRSDGVSMHILPDSFRKPTVRNSPEPEVSSLVCRHHDVEFS